MRLLMTACLIAAVFALGLPMATAEAQLPPFSPFMCTVFEDGVAVGADRAVQAYIGGDAVGDPVLTGADPAWADNECFLLLDVEADQLGLEATFTVDGVWAATTPSPVYADQDAQIVQLDVGAGLLPPTVTTLAADPVGHNSATLRGNLNMGGYTTGVSVWFEYGTEVTSPVTGTAGPFSAPVSGLDPLTTYTYRAVVGYDGMTRTGNTLSFTTSEGPAWPVIQTLIPDVWNVISTPVWLDEDSDRTDDILSGDVVNAYRWTGTRFSSLSKSYKWEPLEAFYIQVSGTTTTATFNPTDEMKAPNKRTLSSKKWALIGPSPIDGTGALTVDEVLAGLNGNYVNVIIPATGGYCTSANDCTLSLPAFGGAWVFVGSEKTRTIAGLYGFTPVETD